MASFDSAAVASSTGLGSLVGNPAVRALYGMPFDVSNAGGFTVWRIGLFVAVLASLWAVLVTTRILRGEEEAGRWDLLLVTPTTRRRTTTAHVAVLAIGAGALGLAAAATFISTGEPAGGAALYGAGLALLTAGFVGVGAATSQLFGTRRRAAGTAAAVLGIAYLVRMIADGSASAGWVRWLSPLGWLENLRAFAGADLLPLVPLCLFAGGAFVVTFVLDARRDTDEGVVREPATARARLRLLGSPLGFAWRERLAGLVGWAGGLLVFGVILGAITKAFVDYIAANPDIQDLTAKFGFTELASVAGFVASMDQVCIVVVCLYAVVGIHRLGEDELADRLDLVYSRPVSRSRWFGAQTLATVGTLAVVLAAIAVGTWVGVVVTGVDFGLDQSIAAVANLAPLVVLSLGVAMLVHGIEPSLVVPIGGGFVVVAYVVTFLGPAANLPDAVVDLSPFAHLPFVPADATDWVSIVVITVIGVALGLAGVVGYRRRDLR